MLPAIAVCAALLALAAGCGSSDDAEPAATGGDTAGTTAGTTASDAGAKKPRIAFLQYVDAGYPEAMRDGAGDYAESVTPFIANFDPQKQNQQCRDAVQSGRYDAILLNAVDPTTTTPCVNAAKAADIPVVAVEIPIGEDVTTSEPQVDGVVGSAVINYATNAESVAALTKDACAGADPCNIIVSVATPTDVLTNQVIPAIESDVPGAKIVQKIVTGYDPSGVTKALPDALTAHPDVDVVVLTADNAAPPAADAVERAGLADQVKLVANGGSRQGVELIEEGILYGTVGGWPRQMGAAAAKMAQQAFNGEAVDPSGVDVQRIDEPLLVTEENVEQFTPEW
jgi:ribose transport system substrate-binding protein